MKKTSIRWTIILIIVVVVVTATFCFGLWCAGALELQVPELILQDDFSVTCKETEGASGYYYIVNRTGVEYDQGVLTKTGKMTIGPFEEGGVYAVKAQALYGDKRSAFSEELNLTVYDVQLPQSDLFTVIGKPYYYQDQNYSFSVQVNEGASGTPAVLVNGEAVNSTDGNYLLTSPTENLVISVEGITSDAYATVTLPKQQVGYTIHAQSHAKIGERYTFTIDLDSAYSESKIGVRVNGELLKPTSPGSYTLENVSEDFVISVEGVQENEPAPDNTTPSQNQGGQSQVPPTVGSTEPSAAEPPATEPPAVNTEIPVNERFVIDSASASITADPVLGTLNYDGSANNTELFFAASDNRACATNWEVSGIITKANKANSLFLSFGVRDETGKDMWFCLLDDSMALQRYWNWWDTKQENDGVNLQYNQAGSDFFYNRNAVLHYRIVLVNDVLQVYFGNDSQALSLAWNLPLTNSTYGGFATGSAYQIGINTVDPAVMTISNARMSASGFVGLSLDELFIRDPYILQANGSYYLYGTKDFGKFVVYTSSDMQTWYYGGVCFAGASDFWGNDTSNSEQAYWAPEVHAYNGAYYMFATFTQAGTQNQQATAILKSDSPLGPFVQWSNGPITPSGHSCLDGTLYIENGVPYLIYAHEWQCTCKSDGVGSMAYIQLSADLRTTVGSPVEWFDADEYTDYSRLEQLFGKDNTTVTDGPFVYEANGQKYLLWSTKLDGTYIQIATKFSYIGEDIHVKNSSTKLYSSDGGHGMTFSSANGADYLVLHTPNSGDTRAVIYYVINTNGMLTLQELE